MLSNIWVWDPGSGKNLFRILDPGVKKALDPGSGSATSVADPGCLSRIPDPDYPSRIPDLGSRIPDPKTATKERGEKHFFVKLFFVATNFTKFIFKLLKKKMWAKFQRSMELFTQKVVIKISKI
jgi:hypothetical protein